MRAVGALAVERLPNMLIPLYRALQLRCKNVNTCKTGVWEHMNIFMLEAWSEQRWDHKGMTSVCPKHAGNMLQTTMQQCNKANQTYSILLLLSTVLFVHHTHIHQRFCVWSLSNNQPKVTASFSAVVQPCWAPPCDVYANLGNRLSQLKTIDIKAYQGAANKETALLGSVVDAAAEFVN